MDIRCEAVPEGFLLEQNTLTSNLKGTLTERKNQIDYRLDFSIRFVFSVILFLL